MKLVWRIILQIQSPNNYFYSLLGGVPIRNYWESHYSFWSLLEGVPIQCVGGGRDSWITGILLGALKCCTLRNILYKHANYVIGSSKERCWFRILPASNQRSEGEKVSSGHCTYWIYGARKKMNEGANKNTILMAASALLWWCHKSNSSGILHPPCTICTVHCMQVRAGDDVFLVNVANERYLVSFREWWPLHATPWPFPKLNYCYVVCCCAQFAQMASDQNAESEKYVSKVCMYLLKTMCHVSWSSEPGLNGCRVI